MKKLKKVLLIGFLLLVVLALLAGLVTALFLDQIVKTGIEKVAPGITQTTVTLDAVHISVLSGSVSLKGFVVGNPQGFTSPQSISVGKAAVSLVPNTLMADKIVIHSINVQAPEVTFEGNPFGDNNLNKIMANVNGGASASHQAAANTPPAAKSSGAAKKLEVDDFSITGIRVHALLAGVSSLPGLEGKTMTLDIPDIHFTQLGTGPDGITAADLTQKILAEVSRETIEAVASSAKGLAGSVLKGVTSDATKVIGGGADTVKKGLGGFLGK
jgi:uncharacterized protein involved in outer membrane biogenesis